MKSSSKLSSYCVYMLRCSDASLYTGITNNIERRLRQHNGEQLGGAKYTKGKGPVMLVYVEAHKTKSEAMKREYHIKHKLSRQEKEGLIKAYKPHRQGKR